MARRIRLALSTLLAAVPCGCPEPRADTAGDTSTQSTATTDSPTPTTTADPTTGGTTAEWPDCAPWEIAPFDFTVGDGLWPTGHHTAACTFAALASEKITAQGETWFTSTLALTDCADAQGDPPAHSLDLVLRSAAPLAAPLAPGQALAVDLSIRTFPKYSTSYIDAWYSLRDATTGELLLAAFADSGPTLAPKIDDTPPAPGWLAPFEAALGDLVCPVEVGAFCDAAPQRAAVRFTRDGATVDVVGGTFGDLGDYRVHLGFAGAPEACDGIPTQHPLHGVLVKNP